MHAHTAEQKNPVLVGAVNHMCLTLRRLPPPHITDDKNTNKTAFEAQRMEIAALHTAGERAVVRTSRIRRELDTSEKELTTLEREMTEIGQFVSAPHTIHRSSLFLNIRFWLFSAKLLAVFLMWSVRNSTAGGPVSGSLPEGNERIMIDRCHVGSICWGSFRT